MSIKIIYQFKIKIYGNTICQQKQNGTFFSLSEPTNAFVAWKKLNALSKMGFSVFLLVLLCEPAGLAVHCENLFHWWAIMPVLLLESKNLIFFWWTKMSFVREPWCWTQKNWVFLVNVKRSLSEREKLNFSVWSTKVNGQNSFEWTRKK